MDFIKKLHNCVFEGFLPEKYAFLLEQFYESYKAALSHQGKSIETYQDLFYQFLNRIIDAVNNPYSFEHYHEAIREPFDYYRFGLEIVRPLILFDQSKVLGLDNFDRAAKQLKEGENAILLANHQTEPDPQAISLLLEKTHPELGENMIFVAGSRVTSDPMAIPFSLGRNLLCIYSKKHIENPPEKKQEKLLHNRRTMNKMSQLLAEGGKCIYVAPSGGRDRPNAEGVVEVAPFDPQSIEMFILMAKHSGKPCHFYPLALSTYKLLPPPNSIGKELGESRYTECTPIHMRLLNEVDMEAIAKEAQDIKELRQFRSEKIWSLVKQSYDQLK